MDYQFTVSPPNLANRSDSRQQLSHQRPGGPISPPCPKCPSALVAADRRDFCAPRNICELGGIEVYFRSLETPFISS